MKKLLIIEDDVFTVKILQHLFTQLNYVLVGVADCESDALNLYNTHTPDLVIVDVHLKGQSKGYDIVSKFERHNSIDIIYLTGDLSNENMKKCMETHPDNFLAKPIDKIQTFLMELKRYKNKFDNGLIDKKEYFRYKDILSGFISDQ